MKQVTKKHYYTASIVVLLLVAILTGCSSSGFDSSRYVKGCLDARTKGEFKDYAELTKSKEETIKRNYETDLKNEVKSISVSFHLDKEMQDKYYTLFKDIYSKCKYEVGEATKGENDTYSIPVTVYKMKLFENTLDTVNDKVKKYFEDNPKVIATSTKIAQMQGKYLADILTEKLKKLEYSEPETITVKVEPSKVNAITYTINSSDYQKVLTAMMDISTITTSSSK